MPSEYEVIIGLEIHVQLKTLSKMFSGDSNADSLEPNVHINPISLGHPGTLPRVNRKAIEYGIITGLALDCTINQFTKFDRKHYFYPDLPKGYQISQYDQPLCVNGKLTIYPDNATPNTVEIERIHLEEDAAKNVHLDAMTLVDFNRAGSPLIEIVTRPDIRSPQAARAFLQELQLIVKYLGISDADMEKGHLRVDANVSLRPVNDSALYPKTEIKNLNSFKAVESALQYEIIRQNDLWDRNEAPEILETRGWDETKLQTYSQRTKEEAADYRYFPEPDLPPLNIETSYIEKLRGHMLELPIAKRERFMKEYFLSYYDAKILTSSVVVADYFEYTISELQGWLASLDSTEGNNEEIWDQHGKKLCHLTCNWITSEIFGLLSKTKQSFKHLKITPENLAELITLVFERRVNSSAAQTLLHHMFEHGSDPSQLIQDLDLEQVNDSSAIEQACVEVINQHPEIITEIQAGKDRKLMYLVGQVMKITKGKANPQVVTDILQSKIL